MGFDPGFERPTCLATLKSSDRMKQSVCGWQYIYIYISGHLSRAIYAMQCRRSDIYLWTIAHARASVVWPTKTYIRSVNTKDVTSNIHKDREFIRIDGERIRKVRTVKATWWYIYIYIYNSTYIGHTSQRLEVRQHVPRGILNTGITSLAIYSAIGEHLLPIYSYRTRYHGDWFSVLHRARSTIHLNILEVIYIFLDHPSLCRQRSCHILHILGVILKSGVT